MKALSAALTAIVVAALSNAALAAQVASPLPADSAAPSLPTPLPSATPLALPPGGVLIVNTGSTNFAGYTIAMGPDGTATVRADGATSHARVAHPQAAWLLSHLLAAGPLDALATRRCMKSASFGSSTFIEYNGARTPDLSCGGDATVDELGRTVNVIVKQMGITQTSRGGRRPLP